MFRLVDKLLILLERDRMVVVDDVVVAADFGGNTLGCAELWEGFISSSSSYVIIGNCGAGEEIGSGL